MKLSIFEDRHVSDVATSVKFLGSPASGPNYARVERHSAVIHLEAISSLVLPN
jgi:hypothetical protein